MKAILGLPDSIVIAPCQSEWDAVVQVMSEEMHDYNTDPVAEGKGGILLEREAVTAFCGGFLQPDWCQGIDTDVEAEGN